jgi:hypothetical protein
VSGDDENIKRFYFCGFRILAAVIDVSCNTGREYDKFRNIRFEFKLACIYVGRIS